MITKINGHTLVVKGSTERMIVHTKIGEFEVPGKRICFNVRPHGNDEFDIDFGNALAKKKFNIGQHMAMAKGLRAIAKNFMEIADKEERIADEMCGKLEDMKCERDYSIENHFKK